MAGIMEFFDSVLNSRKSAQGSDNCLHVKDMAVHPGEKATQDMQISGMGWKVARVTATGTVPGIGPGSIFGGVIVQSGTAVQVTAYDDTAATDATKLRVPITAAMAVGEFASPLGGGVAAVTNPMRGCVGLELSTALHIVLAGTTPVVLVLYR